MRSGKYLLCALLLATNTASIASNQLLEQLRSDHAALVSAEADFHARRERGALNGSELADYASYVARLHRQVAEDCLALTENAMPAPPELSCMDAAAVLISPAAVDQAGEQTSSEKTADLDAELFSGMGDFDEMLLREQQRIKAAAPLGDAGDGGQGGAGAGGEGDGGSGSGSGSDSGSAEHEADGEDDDGQIADKSGGHATYGSGAGPGSTQPQGKNGAPSERYDGSDDDVVARQLREAAEKEPDPVLKEKLWEEYRKYKEGTY